MKLDKSPPSKKSEKALLKELKQSTVFSEAQLIRLRTTFTALAGSKDGSISVEELCAQPETLGTPLLGLYARKLIQAQGEPLLDFPTFVRAISPFFVLAPLERKRAGIPYSKHCKLLANHCHSVKLEAHHHVLLFVAQFCRRSS